MERGDASKNEAIYSDKQQLKYLAKESAILGLHDPQGTAFSIVFVQRQRELKLQNVFHMQRTSIRGIFTKSNVLVCALGFGVLL